MHDMNEKNQAMDIRSLFPEALENRLPGEQWVTLESPELAEAYLASFEPSQVIIYREPWPNQNGLYARLQYPDRVPQDKIFVPLETP